MYAIKNSIHSWLWQHGQQPNRSGATKILGNEATILAPQFSNDLSTVAQIEQNIAEAKNTRMNFIQML